MSQVGTRKHRTPRSWQGALPQYGGRSSDGNLLYYHHTVSEIFFCWSGPAGSWFSGAILARGPNLAKKTGFSDRNFSMVIRRAQNPSSVSLRPMDMLGHYRGRFWDYTVFRRFFLVQKTSLLAVPSWHKLLTSWQENQIHRDSATYDWLQALPLFMPPTTTTYNTILCSDECWNMIIDGKIPIFWFCVTTCQLHCQLVGLHAKLSIQIHKFALRDCQISCRYWER